MKYRLFWAPEAEEDFDSQMRSLGRSTRKELMSLVHQVNTALVEKPNDFGEPRYGNVRIGMLKKLAIQFEVQEDVRTVIIFNVWIMD